MKNKTSFRVKTTLSQFFVFGLIFTILLSPFVAFGQSVQVQTHGVPSSDVWSNGVTIKAESGPVNSRWFEFSVYNDFVQSVNVTPKRSYDGNSRYSEKISGLSADTVYRFRPAVEINGSVYYGSTLTFRTKKIGYSEPINIVPSYSYSSGTFNLNNQGTISGNYSNVGYSYNYTTYNDRTSSLTTKQADFLSYNSARLNANLFPSSEYNVYGWYEWGTTTDLGNSTSRVFIGKGPSLYFGQIISGLTPGTSYYFKPVIENMNGIRVEGTTLVFRTSGISPYSSVNVAADSYYEYGTYNTNYTNNSVKTDSYYGRTGSVKAVSGDSKKTITIEYSSNESTVSLGETLYKKLLLENTTGEDLTHVSSRVILPDGETFVSIEKDICKQIAGQVLFCEIGKMSAGQKAEITYEIEVAKNLKNGTSLEVITISSGEYKDGRKVENFQRTESMVDSNKENANVAAVALFGNTDSSTRDLFISIEFILLLILSYFVWKHLSEKNKKEEINNFEALAYLRGKEAVVPQKQNDFNYSVITEKGNPPTNLPV